MAAVAEVVTQGLGEMVELLVAEVVMAAPEDEAVMAAAAKYLVMGTLGAAMVEVLVALGSGIPRHDLGT